MTRLQTQLDRPEEGLARGRWPAPRWAIAALGLAIVLAAVIYVGIRGYRARRRARGRS